MKLTFNSATGDLTGEFSAERNLAELKLDVMERMKLDPAEAGQYIVACAGRTLDESLSLGQLDLPENEVLILWRTGAAASGTRTWDRSRE